jgi:YHS domain-containing protein
VFAFLARLIAFMIAVSVIRAVVDYFKRFWQGTQSSRPVQRAATNAPPTSTVLQQDPVCGTYVAIDTSLKRIVSGRVYHFCSAECRDKFIS